MDLRDMRPLPVEAVEALHAAEGTPRLLAHLLLVHDVAATLVEAVDRTWPRLRVDAGAVLLGAATHDIGKILYLEEIIGLGTDHAEAGETYLLRHGFTPAQARFARTHETWASEPAARMEDLLVALADQAVEGRAQQRAGGGDNHGHRGRGRRRPVGGLHGPRRHCDPAGRRRTRAPTVAGPGRGLRRVCKGQAALAPIR